MGRDPNIERAKQAAMRALTSYLDVADVEYADAAFLAARVYGWQPQSLDQILWAPPPSEPDGNLRSLVAEAETDFNAFNACALLVELHIDADALIPDPLKGFAKDAVSQRAKPPGRTGERCIARNVAIVFAIEAALREDSGRPPEDRLWANRNDASDPEETESACDLVAECLAEIDLGPKVEGVRKIWKASCRARQPDPKREIVNIENGFYREWRRPPRLSEKE